MPRHAIVVIGLAKLLAFSGLGCAARPASVVQPARQPVSAEKTYWWQYGAADLDPLAARCDGGSKKSCADLAALHEHFGPAFDPKAACELYQHACDLGDEASCSASDACDFRARLHDVGRRLELPELWGECQARTPGACGALSQALLSIWFRGEASPELSKTVQAAIEPAKKECARGDLQKCTFVAFLHAHGLGVERNPKTAEKTLERSCRGGYFAACSLLGAAHSEGGWLDQNEKHASDLFSRGCEGGSAEGCRGIAELAAKRSSGKTGAARKMFALACEWGDFSACAVAAHDECPELDRCSDDQARRASRFLNVAYENDDPDSTARLGLLMLRRDSMRGETLLVRACNFGQAGACYLASRLWEGEQATPQQTEYAARLRERSCALGYAPACGADGEARREVQLLRRAR